MTAPAPLPPEEVAARLSDNRGRTSDGEFIVCPACGYQHGDAWEWASDDRAQRITCDGCGAALIVWAETDVTYHAKVPDDAVAALLRGQPE